MIIISHSNQPYLWDKQFLIVSSLSLVSLLCACLPWNADVWELSHNDGKYFLLGSDVFILHAYCTWYGQHHLHFLNVRSYFSNHPFNRYSYGLIQYFIYLYSSLLSNANDLVLRWHHLWVLCSDFLCLRAIRKVSQSIFHCLVEGTQNQWHA